MTESRKKQRELDRAETEQKGWSFNCMVIDSWDKGLFSSLITSTHFLICISTVTTITDASSPLPASRCLSTDHHLHMVENLDTDTMKKSFDVFVNSFSYVEGLSHINVSCVLIHVDESDPTKTHDFQDCIIQNIMRCHHLNKPTLQYIILDGMHIDIGATSMDFLNSLPPKTEYLSVYKWFNLSGNNCLSYAEMIYL